MAAVISSTQLRAAFVHYILSYAGPGPLPPVIHHAFHFDNNVRRAIAALRAGGPEVIAFRVPKALAPPEPSLAAAFEKAQQAIDKDKFFESLQSVLAQLSPYFDWLQEAPGSLSVTLAMPGYNQGAVSRPVRHAMDMHLLETRIMDVANAVLLNAFRGVFSVSDNTRQDAGKNDNTQLQGPAPAQGSLVRRAGASFSGRSLPPISMSLGRISKWVIALGVLQFYIGLRAAGIMWRWLYEYLNRLPYDMPREMVLTVESVGGASRWFDDARVRRRLSVVNRRCYRRLIAVKRSARSFQAAWAALQGPFTLICGEQNTGKTTLIGKLLGRELSGVGHDVHTPDMHVYELRGETPGEAGKEGQAEGELERGRRAAPLPCYLLDTPGLDSWREEHRMVAQELLGPGLCPRAVFVTELNDVTDRTVRQVAEALRSGKAVLLCINKTLDALQAKLRRGQDQRGVAARLAANWRHAITAEVGGPLSGPDNLNSRASADTTSPPATPGSYRNAPAGATEMADSDTAPPTDNKPGVTEESWQQGGEGQGEEGPAGEGWSVRPRQWGEGQQGGPQPGPGSLTIWFTELEMVGESLAIDFTGPSLAAAQVFVRELPVRNGEDVRQWIMGALC